MPSEFYGAASPFPTDDLELFQMSPFLADLVGEVNLRESMAGTEALDPWDTPVEGGLPSIQLFRRHFRKMVDDTEIALPALRRLRIRTLLSLARADLAEKVRPHQVRARLRALSEGLVQGAWWLAENSLRERYVHPLILERRNINPPLAICSLSRLGSGEPWYTTGPSPIFVHSRAAEFAPALSEKDFELARRSGKEWLPAREYFHRLARRTMSYLSIPDAAGKGFGHMAEDAEADRSPILPGALVVLFSAFEDHFSNQRSVKERLSLMRLRFIVGQEKLGRAVEDAARKALLNTSRELGPRLRRGINAWYRDRAQAEGLPMVKGGLLDIERVIRLVQFRHAGQNPDLLVPSPLKALELLAQARVIDADQKVTLSRAYSWQWFLANRMSLLGGRATLNWEGLSAGRKSAAVIDNDLGLAGAAEKTVKAVKSAREVLNDLAREPRTLKNH